MVEILNKRSPSLKSEGQDGSRAGWSWIVDQVPWFQQMWPYPKRMNIFNSMIQSPTSTQLYLCMPTLLSSLSLNVGVDHLCTPPLKKGPKPLLISNIQSNIFIQQLFEDIVFFFWSIIFDLFYAEKTLLSKLANLWYLLSKKVNFDAQHWLQCTKKVKNNRSMCGKKNTLLASLAML